MASEDVKGTLFTKVSNGGPENAVDGALWGGAIKVQYDYLSDNLESGSTIKVAKLPANARVLAVACAWDGSTSNTVKATIGDSNDANRLATTSDISDMSSAGSILQVAATSTFPKYTSETDIYISTSNANFGATMKIETAIFYVVESD